MNRASRRKLEKQNNKGKTNHAIEQKAKLVMRQEFNNIKQDILAVAIDNLSASFVMSLYDEFGFGSERIARLLKRVSKKFKAINDNEITTEDIKQWLDDKKIEFRLDG